LVYSIATKPKFSNVKIYTRESLWPRINGYNLNPPFSTHPMIAHSIAHKNFIISLCHRTLYIKFGLPVAMCYQWESTYFFLMFFNNSSLFKSMSNLIWTNINIMDLKKYMLICLFISMLMYGKKWYNHKDEDS
jgi:intracellular septation protein A